MARPDDMSERRRLGRLKEILAEAVKRPAAERDGFVIDACGGDAELRREVDSLLRLESLAEGFLDRSPNQLGRLPLAEGARVGAYSILRPLGAGGMGEVYVAERADGAFEQDVAIKVLRAGGIVGELLQRFVAERQLLAELTHPNIARLLDGGTTEDGRPYLVMEHVEGEPIDTYCRRHGLTVAERLTLFSKVCGAVQHAHHHLVVHRDIKPSNILVARDGKPMLLDFGVAKDLGEAGHTPVTRLLVAITPEYASPEQLTGGPVTTAIDVYSLGVVLYELLTGHNPFGGIDPLAGRSAAEPPQRPSSRLRREAQKERNSPLLRLLRRRLDGDLDHIVLRALEPVPQQRYATVEQLQRDIDRHLQGLPLETRQGTWYRLRKQARRHWKGLVAAAAIAMLALFLTSESQQRRQLERESVRIHRLTNTLNAFLIEILLKADPVRSGERSQALGDILEEAAERLEGGLLSDEPLVRSGLMGTIGVVYRSLSRFEEAEPFLREALTIRRRILPRDHKLIGYASNNLGLCLRGLGDFAGARSVLLDAQRIFALHQTADDPDMAGVLNNLAGLEKELGRFDEAVGFYEEALAMKRRLGVGSVDLAKAIKNLGVGLRAAGRLEEAEATLREALRELARSKQLHEPTLAGIAYHLGSLLRERGDQTEAGELLAQALEIRRRLYGEDHPKTVEVAQEIAMIEAPAER